ncbi:hypothetical protein QUF84_10955 [Fictibacillus enclensis]|uniref:hypothetical protein n=1 Tax=Fictibacillus enclensis TaxID=1017270 RepID=UPI0025A243F7|nr:hypothetical protein [Fictibacillus enclensis]MDM5337737.1 hypothetical protein [Fictibacillus enclensis]
MEMLNNVERALQLFARTGMELKEAMSKLSEEEQILLNKSYPFDVPFSEYSNKIVEWKEEVDRLVETR